MATAISGVTLKELPLSFSFTLYGVSSYTLFLIYYKVELSRDFSELVFCILSCSASLPLTL